MAPPIQYATTSDGIRIAYISVGTGSPLVFAACLGEASSYCNGSGPAVTEVTNGLAGLGWRVILYDRRGMGHSDRNVGDQTLGGRVRDLAAVVGQLGLDRFALGGVDIGAATAVAYATEHQAAVSRLVLLSPWASGERYLQIPALRAALAAEAIAGPEWFGKILTGVSSQFKDPEFVEKHAAHFVRSTSLSEFAAFNAANARIDITELLPRVRVPTLVTHEPAFPFGSFELCQEVAAGIRGAEFIVVAENSIAGRMHGETIGLIDRFLRAGTATRAAVGASAKGATTPPAPDGLTPREVEVLRHVAAGSTNKEIAAELGVAVSTIERHLVNLYTKIGARGRAGAIAYTLRHRLDNS
jgi:pimeloyl-ACP methyl ester carboxylesterase/DNA-binding CsgD family transcriptional regulator